MLKKETTSEKESFLVTGYLLEKVTFDKEKKHLDFTEIQPKEKLDHMSPRTNSYDLKELVDGYYLLYNLQGFEVKCYCVKHSIVEETKFYQAKEILINQ